MPSLIDEKLALIKKDFEKQVEACIENSKRLTCEFDERNMHLEPWTCTLCSCKTGEYSDCKTISSVKYILSTYPDKLDKTRNRIKLYLPSKTRVIGPHNTANMDYISCGNKKDHTLKLTQTGDAKLIAFPKDVSLTVEHKDETFINGRLWAKKVLSNNPWKIKEELLKKIEKTGNTNGPYVYNPDDFQAVPIFQVYPVWKDDWTEDFDKDSAEVFYSTMLKKAPPGDWGDIEALREWVANADDVTPPKGKVDLYKDIHNNIILEYDSSDERILSFKHLTCVGAHEEAISEKDYIHGMYGEGIKQANIIFMRRNRWMKIEAVGYTYYPVWGYKPQIDEYLVDVYKVPNNRKHGTKITILNVEEPDKLIKNTKGIFHKWRKDYTIYFEDDEGNQILSPYSEDMENTRCISINGQRSQIIQPKGEKPWFHFNYNFAIPSEKERIELWGRDRKLPDPSKIMKRAKRLLSKIKDEILIRDICEQYKHAAEKNSSPPDDLSDFSSWDLDYDDRDLWGSVAKDFIQDDIELYGIEYIAIESSDEIKNKNLRTLGYHVISWGDGNWLLKLAGLKSASDEEAFPESMGTPNIIEYVVLTDTQKHVFNEAKKNLAFILREYYHENEDYINHTTSDMNYGKYGGIAVAISFEQCKESKYNKIEGMYRKEPINQIFIHRDALKRIDDKKGDISVEYATGILIHELIHGKFNVRDETREFENLLTNISGYTGSRWAQIQTALKEEYKKTNIMMPYLPTNIQDAIIGKKPAMTMKELPYVMILEVPDETQTVKDYYEGKEGYFESTKSEQLDAGLEDYSQGYFYLNGKPGVYLSKCLYIPSERHSLYGDDDDADTHCWKCYDDKRAGFKSYTWETHCGEEEAEEYPYDDKPNC